MERASAAVTGRDWRDLVRRRLLPYLTEPRVWVGLLALSVVVVLMGLTFEALKPVFAAAVIAYVLDDGVSRIEAHRVPRWAAVLIVMALCSGVVVIFVVWFLPAFIEQFARLISDVPRFTTAAAAWLQGLQERYSDFLRAGYGEQIVNRVGLEVQRAGTRLLEVLLASVSGTLTSLINVLIAAYLVVEFLRDKKTILAWIARFIPRPRGVVARTLHRIDREMGAFIRGKALIVLILAGLSTPVYSLLGLESGFVWALLTGLSTLVPYFGAITVYVPLALASYFQFGGLREVVEVSLAYGALVTFEGYFLTPWILGRMSRIHPAAVIVAILFFGSLFGLWGIVLAVPLAIVVKNVLEEVALWLRAVELREASTPIEERRECTESG